MLTAYEQVLMTMKISETDKTQQFFRKTIYPRNKMPGSYRFYFANNKTCTVLCMTGREIKQHLIRLGFPKPLKYERVK